MSAGPLSGTTVCDVCCAIFAITQDELGTGWECALNAEDVCPRCATEAEQYRKPSMGEQWKGE